MFFEFQFKQKEHAEALTYPGELEKGYGFPDMVIQDDGCGGSTANQMIDNSSKNSQIGWAEMFDGNLSQLKCPNSSSQEFKQDV